MPRCAKLLAPLGRSSAGPAASSLTVMAAVEALAAVVCEPGSRTTDSKLLATLLQVSDAVAKFLIGRSCRCWMLVCTV